MLLHQTTTVTFKPTNCAGLLSHLISRSVKNACFRSSHLPTPMVNMILELF